MSGPRNPGPPPFGPPDADPRDPRKDEYYRKLDEDRFLADLPGKGNEPSSSTYRPTSTPLKEQKKMVFLSKEAEAEYNKLQIELSRINYEVRCWQDCLYTGKTQRFTFYRSAEKYSYTPNVTIPASYMERIQALDKTYGTSQSFSGMARGADVLPMLSKDDIESIAKNVVRQLAKLMPPTSLESAYKWIKEKSNALRAESLTKGKRRFELYRWE